MNPMLRAAIASLVIGLACATAARAEDPHPYPLEGSGVARTRVPFADFGSILDWRVDHTGGLLIRTASERYYRADFAGPCPELPTAINIGFVTEVAGSLDTWSSIYVDGDRCWFKSFRETDRATFDQAR
ncbi:MAG: hypothetical protein JWR84_2098 [Caulobacter sp.]|nr:hypothetical protein [Caulobacter sp.]